MTSESTNNLSGHPSTYLNQIADPSKTLKTKVLGLKNIAQGKINERIHELELDIIKNQSTQHIGTTRILKKIETKRLKDHIKQLKKLNKTLNNLNKKLENTAEGEFLQIHDFSDRIIKVLKESHDKDIFKDPEIHHIISQHGNESAALQQKMEGVRNAIQSNLALLKTNEKKKIENTVKQSLGPQQIKPIAETTVYSETVDLLDNSKQLLIRFDNVFSKPFYLEERMINFRRGLYKQLLKEQRGLESDLLKAKTEPEIQKIKMRCKENNDECQKFINNALPPKPRNHEINYEKLSIIANGTESKFLTLKAKLAREKDLSGDTYFTIINFLEGRRSAVIEAASRGAGFSYELKLEQFQHLLENLENTDNQSLMKKWLSIEKEYNEALNSSKIIQVKNRKQALMDKLNKELNNVDPIKNKEKFNNVWEDYFNEVEKLLPKDEKAHQTNLQHDRLNSLMSDDDLDLIWNNKKDPLSGMAGAATTWETIYNYINGITNINGEVQDLAVLSNDHLSYFRGLRSIIDENSPVRVSLQTRNEKNISADTNEQIKLITPFDDSLKDEALNDKFQKLPSEHQEYIRNTTKETSGISQTKQQELLQQERDLKQILSKEQQKDFEKFMSLAIAQSATRKGFIHFRIGEAAKTTPFERIYIQMNKDHTEELVRLLISELYKEGEYPGILDLKVAGPQEAGRTDGIVIYIGEATPKAANDLPNRQKAIKERDRVLNKLKEIQKKRPDLFGNDTMPFKKMQAPGIAIIPELSTTESFTEKLSKAIVSALKNSTSREDFRKKIIESFFAE